MIKSNFKEIAVLENKEPDYFKFAHEASLVVLEMLQKGKPMSNEDSIEKIELEEKTMRDALKKTESDDVSFEKGYLSGLNYCLSILKGI